MQLYTAQIPLGPLPRDIPMTHISAMSQESGRLVTKKSCTWIMKRGCQSRGSFGVSHHRDMSRWFGKILWQVGDKPVCVVLMEYGNEHDTTNGLWHIADLSWAETVKSLTSPCPVTGKTRGNPRRRQQDKKKSATSPKLAGMSRDVMGLSQTSWWSWRNGILALSRTNVISPDTWRGHSSRRWHTRRLTAAGRSWHYSKCLYSPARSHHHHTLNSEQTHILTVCKIKSENP